MREVCVFVRVCVYHRNILAEGQGGNYGLRWIETQQADVDLWNLLVKKKKKKKNWGKQITSHD